MDRLRSLPKVDKILEDSRIKEEIIKSSRDVVVNKIRTSINKLRESILSGEEKSSPFSFNEEVIKNTIKLLEIDNKKELKRVINATGIVIHTNLGRSLICERGIKKLIEVARGYSNLEYNLEEGKRGSRAEGLINKLKYVTNAEEALIVNNNAAGVLLVLSTLCMGKEVVISRGELVEIGGSFRVPEIMELSGCMLKEVGTTNRTHLRDYENVIGEGTGGVLKVHTSNYKIMGFVKEVSTEELEGVCKKFDIPLIEDLGSGLLNPLNIGEIKEESIIHKMKKGVDIITFSGDKLLGGPQCGIIIGKKKYIDKMKKNPLLRALRVDKFTIAALEGTLDEYILNNGENIKTLKMINQPINEIKNRVSKLICEGVEIKEDISYVGGGALPTEKLKTWVAEISHKNLSENEIEKILRNNNPPIISRINNKKVIIDGRCLLDEDIEIIIKALEGIKWAT